MLDYASKYYYKIHPEKIKHYITGLELDTLTFWKTLKNPELFEYLIPFVKGGALIYPIIFIILAIVAIIKKKSRVLFFIIPALLILLVTFAIPKVQTFFPIPNAGIFFSISRFYLSLPILVLLSCYLIFKEVNFKQVVSYLLIGLGLTLVVVKNIAIENSVKAVMEKTSFPVSTNQALIDGSNTLNALCEKYDIELIVHKRYPAYDSFAFYALINNKRQDKKEVISVNYDGDRRSWLYEDAKDCQQILLIGLVIDEKLLKQFDYEIIGDNYVLIKKSNMDVKSTFKKLGLEFSNVVHDN